MKNRNVNPRLFALLCLSFVIVTIAGTLSHEMGHIAVARYFGYETRLFYASSGQYTPRYKAVDKYYKKYKNLIISGTPSPEKASYFRQYNTLKKEDNAINLGGPLQTIITGTVGVIALCIRRRKISKKGMRFTDWFFLMLAFFWSRQLFNFLIKLYSVLKGHRSHSDESKIDSYYNLPVGTVSSISALVATVLLSWLVFFVLPKQERITFLASGICGSILGWFIWMHWLGPILLP
jgi:hypothetical protein